MNQKPVAHTNLEEEEDDPLLTLTEKKEGTPYHHRQGGGNSRKKNVRKATEVAKRTDPTAKKILEEGFDPEKYRKF